MDHKKNLLIVDDDPSILRILQYFLESEGYTVFAVDSASDALDQAASTLFDLALVDLRLDNEEIDGVQLMRELHHLDPLLPVIILTAYGTIANAVEAIKGGAYSYVTKPFDHQELLVHIVNGLERSSLSREVKRLQTLVGERYGLNNIIGKSAVMQDVLHKTVRAAETESTVLIYGESGTGKELIAKSLHVLSARKDNPFVAINCSSIPEGLLESELFGHEKGAFTGAIKKKRGLINQADSGTLFLDEISETPLPMQAKLLRVLEEKECYPVGAETPIHVDLRIIAAANKNLESEVKKGTFREDLYYRLHVIPIYLPPLRERIEDLPLLVDHFLSQFASQMNKDVKYISREAMHKLLAYSWPGNVRELENTLEYAVAMSSGQTLESNMILQTQSWNHSSVKQLKEAKSDFERDYLTKILILTQGNISKAASLAGKFRADFYTLLKKYGIRAEEFKKNARQ